MRPTRELEPSTLRTFQVTTRLLSPSQLIFGPGTLFWVDPTNDVTVLFFTQVLFAPDEIWLTLRRMVYQALVGA